MNRRRFLIASGSAILSGSAVSSISQEPVMALDFNINSVEDASTSNIDSIKVEFSGIKLTPQYIKDSQPAEITVTVDLNEFGSVKRNIDINLNNGKSSDLSSEIGEIVIDDIEATQNDYIRGTVEIKVEHPSVQDSWKQSFNYSESVPSSTGGDEIVEKTINGSTYRLHIFRNDGSFSINADYNNAYILVVGGGGGGGQGEGGGGGGGGAGGVALAKQYQLAEGSYNITIGSGGAGGNAFDSTGEPGNNGGDSYFDSIRALGGGRGSAANDGDDGGNGGSGGGACDGANAGSGGGYQGLGNQPNTNSSEIEDYGNRGGTNNDNDTGSGGGGAMQNGQSEEGGGASGDGGDGIDLSNIFGTDVGDNGAFAGGGGGASDGDEGGGSAGSGGLGGGGRGTDGGSSSNPGIDGTGGGGGAGADNWGHGYDGRRGEEGGDGIVIVRLGPL